MDPIEPILPSSAPLRRVGPTPVERLPPITREGDRPLEREPAEERRRRRARGDQPPFAPSGAGDDPEDGDGGVHIDVRA